MFDFSAQSDNVSSNLTDSETNEVQFSTSFALIMGFLDLLFCVENILTIATITRDVRLRERFSNQFIVSLAVTDLGISLFATPFAIMYYSMDKTWTLGPNACLIWLFADFFFCITSLFHLMAISVDRFYVITKPFVYRNKMSPKKTLLAIALLWTVPMFLALPPLIWNDIMWSTNKSSVKTTCDFYDLNIIYGTVLLIGVDLPSLVLFILYYKVYRAAVYHRNCVRRGVKEVREMGEETTVVLRLTKASKVIQSTESCVHSLSLDGDYPEEKGRNASRWEESHKKLTLMSKEYRAAQTIGLIVGSFFVCWIPGTVVYFLIMYCKSCLPNDTSLESLCLWLSHLNPGLNPVVFFFLNKDYRNSFRKLLTTSERQSESL